MRTVYADIVFGLNFFIDYILLYLCSHSMYIRVRQPRLILAAVFGGVYAVIAEVFVDGNVMRIITGLVVMFFMSLILIGKRNVDVYIRFMVTVYTFSFLLCGFVSMLSAHNTKITMTVIIVCSFVLPVWIILKERMFYSHRIKRAKAIIKLGQEEISLSLICDSGNILVDPYTASPVIVVNKRAVGKFSDNDEMKRIVPVKTAGGKSLISVITPDVVAIKSGNKLYPVNACIGFNECETDMFSEADGIIPVTIVSNI